MSDYWKSQPRKFCEYCKCWLADNKPSIQAHESGKRHRDAVAAKIADVQKQGQKDYEEKKKLEADFKRMEKKAALAYEKDLERLHEERIQKLREEERTLREEIEEEDRLAAEEQEEAKESTAALVASTGCDWFEAKSPEGYSYYWNVKTNETSWIVPAEGFVSLEAQAAGTDDVTPCSSAGEAEAAPISPTNSRVKQAAPQASTVIDTEVTASVSAKKPVAKPTKSEASEPPPCQWWNAKLNDPYGAWQPAESFEKPKKKETDLQLPKQDKPQLQVPTLHRQPGIKFREKSAPTVAAGSALEVFKKRKLDSERMKYVRKPSDN